MQLLIFVSELNASYMVTGGKKLKVPTLSLFTNACIFSQDSILTKMGFIKTTWYLNSESHSSNYLIIFRLGKQKYDLQKNSVLKNSLEIFDPSKTPLSLFE
jgi:hypothetical protein